MNTVYSLVLAAMLGLVLGGCSSHHQGGAPEPSSDIEADLRTIEKTYGLATSLETALSADTATARDKLIAGRLLVMNLRYMRFVREVTADKQAIDSASDILVLTLNLAGAALGDATTKTVLAAVSAGILGSRISIDKNYYYEKTMPALVAAMNAERRKALIPLFKGMKMTIEDYSVAQAVTDLQAYYEAGTLIGAINAVTAEAGEQEKTANLELQKLQDLQSLRKRVLAITQLDLATTKEKVKTWYNSIPSDPFLPKDRVAALILDSARRTVPNEKIADALIDKNKKQPLLDLLTQHSLETDAKLLRDIGAPSVAFRVDVLIEALDAAALSELLASSDLKDQNILKLK